MKEINQATIDSMTLSQISASISNLTNYLKTLKGTLDNLASSSPEIDLKARHGIVNAFVHTIPSDRHSSDIKELMYQHSEFHITSFKLAVKLRIEEEIGIVEKNLGQLTRRILHTVSKNPEENISGKVSYLEFLYNQIFELLSEWKKANCSGVGCSDCTFRLICLRLLDLADDLGIEEEGDS